MGKPSRVARVLHGLADFLREVERADPERFRTWTQHLIRHDMRTLRGDEWLSRPAVTEAEVTVTLPPSLPLKTDTGGISAKIGAMVALECKTKEQVKRIADELTIEEPVPASVKERHPYVRGKRIKFYKLLGRQFPLMILVPRAWGMERFGIDPAQDFRQEGDAWPEEAKASPPFEPYRAQREVLDAVHRCFENKAGRCTGIIDVPCGMGKTLLAALAALREGGVTWVMVPSTIVQNQFMNFFTGFFPDLEVHALNGNTPIKRMTRGKRVGMWTREEITKRAHIVVATPEMIGRLSPADVQHVRLFIIDECHHIPAETFFHNVCIFSCRRVLGMSATPEKFNVFDRALNWTLGGTIAHVKRGPVKGGAYQLRYYPVNAAYNPNLVGENARGSYHGARSIMMQDPHRNDMLIKAMASLCDEAKKVRFKIGDRVVHPRVLMLVKLHKHAVGLAARLGAPIPASTLAAQKSEDKKVRAKMPRIKVDTTCDEELPCAQFLDTPTPPIEGTRLLVGTMDAASRAEARREGRLIIATVDMAREGLDLPDVFVVVFDVLEHRITQIIGRGCRINSNLDEARMVMVKDTALFRANAIYNNQESTLRANGWEVVPWDPRKTSLPPIAACEPRVACAEPEPDLKNEPPPKRARREPRSAAAVLSSMLAT